MDANRVDAITDEITNGSIVDLEEEGMIILSSAGKERINRKGSKKGAKMKKLRAKDVVRLRAEDAVSTVKAHHSSYPKNDPLSKAYRMMFSVMMKKGNAFFKKGKYKKASLCYTVINDSVASYLRDR